jgi:hypothetical protein
MEQYTGLVAALELLFPICRSELLTKGVDPSPVRLQLDRHTSLRHISDDFLKDASDAGLNDAGKASRLFLDLAQMVDKPPSISEAAEAVMGVARSLAAGSADALEEARGDLPSTSEQLSWFATDLFEGARSLDYVRVNGSLVGRSLDERLFVINLDSAGHNVGAAVELDAAARLLPSLARFDKREGGRAMPVLMEAISTGWEVLAGPLSGADPVAIDIALQGLFVDTDRFPSGDWTAWMASRSVDAAYAALGFVFGKTPYPPAVIDARSAAVDSAAISRGIDPWDLSATYRTLVDPAVLEEVRHEIEAVRLAKTDPMSLRGRLVA